MSINSLGYIGIFSNKRSDWARFGSDVLGMEDVTLRLNDNSGNLYLKMDDRPFRVLVIESGEERFGFCGWECNSEERLEEALQNLHSADIDIESASKEETQQRRVNRLYRFCDPAGNRHEIYWGVISDFRKLVSPVGLNKFVTGDLGMGHVVLPAPNFEETAEFFRDTLGFGLSDVMNIRFTDDPAEPAKRLWFMHCNARHHSLALFEMPHPAGCIHCMVEVDDIDEVGRGEDRRIQHDVPLSATLGRHANDHMLSFYMQTPSGFDIEYGAQGRTITDWDKYSRFESTVSSLWGHDFNKTIRDVPNADN